MRGAAHHQPPSSLAPALLPAPHCCTPHRGRVAGRQRHLLPLLGHADQLLLSSCASDRQRHPGDRLPGRPAPGHGLVSGAGQPTCAPGRSQRLALLVWAVCRRTAGRLALPFAPLCRAPHPLRPSPMPMSRLLPAPPATCVLPARAARRYCLTWIPGGTAFAGKLIGIK